MSGAWLLILIWLAALGSGLMAGVFFAFSVFVMQGLKRLPAAQGVAAMQVINIAVINPLFLGVFLGTGVLCMALAVIALLMWPYPGIGWLIAGAAIYVVGSIGVTMLFNVPRNNLLAPLMPESAEATSYWPRYVAEWTRWNHLRTIACVAAMAAFIVAMA